MVNKIFFSLFLVATLSWSARAAETKIVKKDIPAPVQKAVDEQTQGASIRGFTKEVENGKTEYEAELTVNGHGKDISFDSEGKVVAVEEEVTLQSLPAPARAAIQKAAEGQPEDKNRRCENRIHFAQNALLDRLTEAKPLRRTQKISVLGWIISRPFG